MVGPSAKLSLAWQSIWESQIHVIWNWFQDVAGNQKTFVFKIVTIDVGQLPLHVQSSLDAFGMGRALVPTFEQLHALWRTSTYQHRGQTVTSTTHLDVFCYLQKNNTIIEQFFWRRETQSVSKWLSFQNSKYLVWLMFHTLAYSFQDLFSWIFAMFTASVFTDGTWAFADCRFRFDRS